MRVPLYPSPYHLKMTSCHFHPWVVVYSKAVGEEIDSRFLGIFGEIITLFKNNRKKVLDVMNTVDMTWAKL